MNLVSPRPAARPSNISEAEWKTRVDLAACYRLVHHHGMAMLVYNHITARVPGPERHYLINPFGLNYDEVTATNLVKVNLAGEAVDGSPHMVNKAGFVIHSAVHAAREDAHCLIHTHTTAIMGVACKREGLRYDNFYSAQLHGLVATHPFEGITTDVDEQKRLVANLGDKPVLMLKNHGVLVAGPHIPQALTLYWTVQRGCEVQLAADSLRGDNEPVGQAVLDAIPAQAQFFRTGAGGGPRRGQLFFDALMRRAGLRYEDLA